MRLTRWRFPRLSWLLFTLILFLILCLAAYIAFLEKCTYSHFSYFHRASEVLQVRIQQATVAPIIANAETPKPPDVILGSDSSPLEQDAVKRLGAISELYAQDAAFQGSMKPTEKQTRSISGATKNAAEDKLRSTPNQNRNMSPTAGQNHPETVDATLKLNKKQDEKAATTISYPKEEKNKATVPKHQGKKQAEAVHVTQASTLKQTTTKDGTTASNLLRPQGPNVTPLSSSNQTMKKQTRETGRTKVHFAKVEPFSVIKGHNASSSEVQQVTPLILPTAPRNRFKASDFKSEPLWDFEDQYLLDNSTAQSSCPDSLRVKAAKSDWLKDVFLPNITLFMDRSHFSDSEWERMEHFPPPFGFMELNYSLVKEVITMLPPKPYHQILSAHNSSSNQTSRCVTCAVVGNGGILNNSRMGQEIDSHDYVFRVSGAVIKGYEEDVGTRTSFYGFTAYSLMASLVSLRNRGFRKIPMGKEIKYLHFLEGTRDYEWLKALLLDVNVRKGFLDYYGARPWDVFSNNFDLDKYFVIHPDFTRYIKNRFLRSKTLDKHYWRIYRPTTGALLLLTALHLCDQVSAYGYITEGYKNYSDHYYDKQWKRLIFYTNHDFDLERRVWKKLHDEKIMKLYQRS